MKYLLDTHTWIWWHLLPSELSPTATQTLANAPARGDELLLSAISFWEFSKLVQKGRLGIASDGLDWIDQALSLLNVRVVEITAPIAWHSTRLPLPFHDDPADQLLVATARAEGATIITRDRLIRQYPHVKSLW